MTNEEFEKIKAYESFFKGKKSSELTQKEREKVSEMKALWTAYESARSEFEKKYSYYTTDQCIDYKHQYENLKKRRNMTDQDIAEYIHISPQSLSGYGHGKQSPSIGVAIGICMALGLDIEEATTLLASLGVCLISSCKEHAAYLYLIRNYKDKSAEECNNLLDFFGIDKKYHIKGRPTGKRSLNTKNGK